MRISISQWSLPGNTLYKRLQWARKYGFVAVELHCSPVPADLCGLHVPAMQFSQIRELKETLAGCESVTLHAPFQDLFDVSLVSVNPRIREAGLQDIILTLRLAEALGAGVVTCHTGLTTPFADPAEVRDNLQDSLRRLSQEAGAVKIGFEAADWFLPLDRFELLRDLKLPNIGITLDIGHAQFDCATGSGARKPAYAAYGDVPGFIRAFGDLLVGVHVHDYDGEKDHLALGRGATDLPAILLALQEVGYDGDLTLELNPESCGPESVLYSKQLIERLLRPPDDEPLPPWAA